MIRVLRRVLSLLVLWLSLLAPLRTEAATATLTWDANTEPDLAGYKIYRLLGACGSQGPPAFHDQNTADYNRYDDTSIPDTAFGANYEVTAFDSSGNESPRSLRVCKSIAPPTVTLTVVGSPATGPWAVSSTVSVQESVRADIYDGDSLLTTDYVAPYCSFGDDTTGCILRRMGAGPHTIEFRFFHTATDLELGRGRVTVVEGATSLPDTTPPQAPKGLQIAGRPGPGEVLLTWNSTGSQDHFELERIAGTRWLVMKSTTALSVRAPLPAGPGRRLFRVCAVKGPQRACPNDGVWASR
jgi:hypothetical protein